MEFVGFVDLDDPLNEDDAVASVKDALDGRRSCLIAYNVPSDCDSRTYQGPAFEVESAGLHIDMASSEGGDSTSNPIARYWDVASAMERAFGIVGCKVTVDTQDVLSCDSSDYDETTVLKFNGEDGEPTKLFPFFSDLAACTVAASGQMLLGSKPDRDMVAVIWGVGDGCDPFFQLNSMECIEAAFKCHKVVALSTSPVVVSTMPNGSVLTCKDYALAPSPVDTYNQSLNRITEALFDVSTIDPKVRAMRQKVTKLCSEGDVDGAEEVVSELRSMLGRNDIVEACDLEIKQKRLDDAKSKADSAGSAGAMLGGLAAGMSSMGDVPGDIIDAEAEVMEAQTLPAPDPTEPSVLVDEV